MVIFALRVEPQNYLDLEVVEKFIDDTATRLKSNNSIKNPLKGRIKKFSRRGIYVISMEPLIFNFSVFGWFVAAGTLLLFGFVPFLIAPILIGCAGVFWSRRFFAWLCVRGLRKEGYHGVVEILKHKEIIQEVILC